MPLPSELLTLAQYLSGEFENREQAADEPVWYVHLRLWQRPVKLFAEDSVTIFAEQASVVNLDKPYRQRLLRLMRSPSDPTAMQVQYYGFKDPSSFRGAGQAPAKLESLAADQVELLPECILEISQNSDSDSPRFIATAPPGACCRFQYDGKVGQVALGFEISADDYLTYDKGIDPETGSALWGAIMGPYRYKKTQRFSDF